MRVNVNVMRLMIGLILRVRMPILKGTVTCQNSQKGVGNDRLQFTANNERAVQTLKPSSAQKNALREFLVIYIFLQEFDCKFAHWFSSIFQSLQMHCHIFCNLAYSSRILASKKKSGNHDLHSQKQNLLHVAIQVQAF